MNARNKDLMNDNIILEGTVAALPGTMDSSANMNAIRTTTITHRRCEVPQEHAHLARLTTVREPFNFRVLERLARHVLSRCREVSIIGAGGVLNGHRHAVIALAALRKVVVLEAVRDSALTDWHHNAEYVLEGSLGETIAVRDIVDRVHDVERIHACSVDVHGGGGSLRGDLHVLEVKVCAGLRGSGRG